MRPDFPDSDDDEASVPDNNFRSMGQLDAEFWIPNFDDPKVDKSYWDCDQRQEGIQYNSAYRVKDDLHENYFPFERKVTHFPLSFFIVILDILKASHLLVREPDERRISGLMPRSPYTKRPTSTFFA